MFLKASEPEKSRKLFRGDGRENIRKIRLAERKSEFSYKAYFFRISPQSSMYAWYVLKIHSGYLLYVFLDWMC